MRACSAVAWLLLMAWSWPAVCAASDAGGQRPFDTRTRVAWTTSRVVGTPDPALPFRLRRVFEHLPLDHPLFLTHIPASGELLVIEHQGKILFFVPQPDVTSTNLLLDVGEETYSVAFDPGFATNGYVYVFSNGPRDVQKKRNRIARYTMAPESPRKIDPASRHLILEYESNGHNGGDLAFGPDGYLYISAGDGTSDSDTDLTGQELSDLPSAILRIDVHAADAERGYAIPADNPFIGTAGAHGEIWAYGLRNPWRISFDHEGRLWVGDVGQDWREMIFLIARGGNYGWSVEEGGLPFQPLRDRGPTPIVPPVVFHPHSEARSITGGHVYYGQRFPELRGAYIYGDYATGRVWGLRYDGRQITWQRELADSTVQMASFGADTSGELYIVDYVGAIYELTPNDAPARGNFPRRLSETGLFSSVPQHEPAEGVIPYSVNSPLWSDGASKERLLALPETSQIQFTESRGWNFADGAVVVKTFSLPVAKDGAAAARRIETRLLVRQQGEWSGYSYAWNDEQTDADLVPAAGADRSFVRSDGTTLREQLWHFPSRAECMMCHTRAANYVLGLSTLQLNRMHEYGNTTENQLVVLDRLGLFRDPLPKPKAEMPALPDPRDQSATIADRARSYLHANCSHCHVSAGGGNARLELEYTTPLEKMNLLDERPLHDRFDIQDALLLSPGAPQRSLILSRVRRTERGRMPPLASSVVDIDGAGVLERWIAEMPAAH